MPGDALDFLVDKELPEPNLTKKTEDAPPVKKEDSPPPAPKKEDKKVEQLREVAKQRDDLKSRVEALEKEAEDLRKFKEGSASPALKKVEEYLKKKFGAENVDEEVVNKFIEHNQKRKKEVEETSRLAKTQEEIIKDLDINMSYEFNEKYRKPLATHTQALFAELAPVDNEGKVKNGPLVEGLYKELLSLNEDRTPLTPVQIKGVLQKFVRSYNAKTGEDYEVPNITNLVNSINSVHVANSAMINARKNWETEKKKNEEEKKIQSSEHARRVIETELHERETVFNKVISEFKFEDLDGISDKDVIQKSIRDAHTNLIDKIQGKSSKPMSYDEWLTSYAKAAAYDDLLKRVRELETENASMKEKGKSGLGFRSSVTNDKPKQQFNQGPQKDVLDFVR